MSKKCRKKWLKRIISLMLALVLTTLPAFQEVSYAANNKKKTEQYLDGVFERFETYAAGNYVYNTKGGLCSDEAYNCNLYVKTMKEKTELIKYEPSEDEGFWERLKNRSVTHMKNTEKKVNTAFAWASSTLTGTGLSKSAYMDYLSKIVAMQERSFLETAQAQAEYAIRVDVGEELINILEKSTDMALADRNFKDFQTKLGDLFGKEEVKRIKKVLKDARKIIEE